LRREVFEEVFDAHEPLRGAGGCTPSVPCRFSSVLLEHLDAVDPLLRGFAELLGELGEEIAHLLEVLPHDRIAISQY